MRTSRNFTARAAIALFGVIAGLALVAAPASAAKTHHHHHSTTSGGSTGGTTTGGTSTGGGSAGAGNPTSVNAPPPGAPPGPGCSQQADPTCPGYPGTVPPPPPPPPPPGNSVMKVAPGTTKSETTCGFAAGSTVDTYINNTKEGTATAGKNGCVTIPYNATASAVSAGNGPAVSVSSSSSKAVLEGTTAAGYRVVDTLGLQIPGVGPVSQATAIAATALGSIVLLAMGSLLVIFTRRRGRRPIR
jgi:hypothetical protein